MIYLDQRRRTPGVPDVQITYRPAHRAAAAFIALGFATGQLAGCTNVGGGNVELAVDPGDPCGQYRAQFAQSKTFFTDQIVSGAVTGGAVGALGGALIGGLTGGGRGALIGALAGGAAGAIAGGTSAYYQNMQQHAHDQSELARGINSDLDREITELDHVNATFASLRECRFNVAQQVKYQVRTGQISRPAAVTTLDFERRMFDQEIAVARQYGATMQKRDDQFQVAADNLAKNDPNYVPPPNTAVVTTTRTTHVTTTHRTAQAPLTPSQQAVASATQTIPEKRSSFTQSVDDAATKSQVAFNLDAPNPA
jgi:hypothetical protein